MVQLKYDTDIDLANLNTSHALMADMVGGNKRVLDVGCATGYMARALADRGCVVSGLEQDALAAEEAAPHLDRLVVANLETTDLVEAFGAGGYDIVLFGDVLEHLADPLAVLRKARPLLAPKGSVIASIPNVAHGSVRLALLRGRFDYQPLGLLDETHLRFFTRNSVERMFRDAGLVVVETRRTTTGLFESHVPLDESDYPPELIETVLQDPEALTYQFVVRGVDDDADAAVNELHAREQEQRVRLRETDARLKRAEEERDDAVARNAALCSQVLALEEQLGSLSTELRAADQEVDRIMQSRLIRYTGPLRDVYSAMRRMRSR